MELPRKCPLFLQTKPWYKHRRMCPVKKLMSSGRTGETHKEVVDLDSRTVLWFGDKKGAILRNPSELEPEIWAVWLTAVSSTFKPKTRCSLLIGALLAAVPVSPYGKGTCACPSGLTPAFCEAGGKAELDSLQQPLGCLGPGQRRPQRLRSKEGDGPDESRKMERTARGRVKSRLSPEAQT